MPVPAPPERTHNDVNETTSLGLQSGGSGTNWVDPNHDAAGNMTTIPQPNDPNSPYTLTYDAWNRLVAVNDGTTDVQVNEYDGLNRRIIRDETGGGGELKHFYYNSQWQVLVEADSSNDASAMYSYHPHYVDAVAFRIRESDGHIYLHDANFNVTSVMNASGTVVERYIYTPYGEPTVLDADFSPDPNGVSDIDNEYLYTGRRLDPETGLQLCLASVGTGIFLRGR